MSHEHEGAGPKTQKNATEHPSLASQKEWREPVLRKLPIAATAGAPNKIPGNEGSGGGKGDAQTPTMS
jgi:hypothetical protein